jgi:hypothetical protein
MIRISLLSIMISLLLFGPSIVPTLSLGESERGFCYDEVGDMSSVLKAKKIATNLKRTIK